VVAQAAATLDRLSAGRFNLGVGTGENLNEGPLGYSFPKYAERAARMSEALDIMRRLLDGEKLTYDGEYYTTDRAKLYSPPVHDLPLFMAAGGPKSAALAARKAEGIITSVKQPEVTFERVIDPARSAAAEAGRPASHDPCVPLVGESLESRRGLADAWRLARSSRTGTA
jgi:coenzyme F420-dependent glucose-6-phosphate dehydrogenase